MSYDLKYQSDFYNTPPFQKKVSVQLYKKDYGTHAVILVRTTEVILQANYQDDDTPVIGTGVKIGIVNQGEFDSLEDLLTATEKEFKCVITYDGNIVFQGFNICDLNEQQFLPLSKISLQFTDYLHRLDVDYLNSLEDISAKTSIYAILAEMITNTGLQNGTDKFPLYVNSTLFETTMSQGAASTFISQTYVENVMFYTSALSYDAINKISLNDYENTYDVVNKLLLSFGAYLYSAGDKFIIERLDDVIRGGNWVKLTDMGGGSMQGFPVTSHKKEYNKQSDDFKYVDESQIVEYNSGWQRLDLDLQVKGLDSLVFNDYITSMPIFTGSLFPVPSAMDLNKWYRQADIQPMFTGYYFRSNMSQYIKWIFPLDGVGLKGLAYKFEITFNVSQDTSTDLSISYKASGEIPLELMNTVTSRFCLIVSGGPLDGFYVGTVPGPTGDSIKGFSPVAFDPMGRLNGIFKSDFDVSVTGMRDRDRVWSVNEDINFSDGILVNAPHGFPPFMAPSLWEQLGRPAKQSFILYILPVQYTPKFNYSPPIFESTNYLGDVRVTISQPEVLNKLRYYINEDFMKREAISIDFFDFDNSNFSNGLLTNMGLTKTNLWISDQFVTPTPLMDILARTKFGANCKTMNRLKGKILCGEYLKPFSILTDDNLKVSGDVLKLILKGYTWDLNEGTYEIEAVEYGGEETDINNSLEKPPIPTGLTVTQAAGNDPMEISWDAMTGATGYILQRFPETNNGGATFQGYWQTVYTGANASYEDNLQNSANPGAIDGYSIRYRVCAYNANGSSLNSSEKSCIWHLTDVPAIPSGLVVDQTFAGDPMIIHWDSVSGATGYILQRFPETNNGGASWQGYWQTVYTGSNTTYADVLQNVVNPSLINGATFQYKVCAYNANGNSPDSLVSSHVFNM
jgi:hypothetical protein